MKTWGLLQWGTIRKLASCFRPDTVSMNNIESMSQIGLKINQGFVSKQIHLAMEEGAPLGKTGKLPVVWIQLSFSPRQLFLCIMEPAA